MKRGDFIKTIIAGSSALLYPGSLLAKFNKNIPNVLLLGDSISIGYTNYIQEMLAGKANVHRPFNDNGGALNCQGTTFGVKNIDRWLGDTKWDVIHFNFGLHDLKHMDPAANKNSNNPDKPLGKLCRAA